MGNNSKLNGVDSIGKHLFMSQIENNMKSFLDWGLLNIGGFINVLRPQSNIYGNPISILKPTEDPSYTSGQVWQTMRKDWVWEDTVVFKNTFDPPPSPSPVPSVIPKLITGIYINNTFYDIATNNETYKYIVDYINSRIIFDNAIPTNTSVSMEYAYRWVQVYNYDNAKWWQQLQYKTDQNAKHFNQIYEGDFSVLTNNRIQLPAIVIETAARGTSSPFQLGTQSLIMRQDILLHIVAETMHDRNIIIDILRLQQDRTLDLYDINSITTNKTYPFNVNGTLNNNRLRYDQLIDNVNYTWKSGRLLNVVASDVQSFSPFLSESTVRMSVEIIFGISSHYGV